MTKNDNYRTNSAYLLGSIMGITGTLRNTWMHGGDYLQERIHNLHGHQELGWAALYCNHEDFEQYVAEVARYRAKLDTIGSSCSVKLVHFESGYEVWALGYNKGAEAAVFGPIREAAFAEHVRLFLASASVEEFREIIFREAILGNSRARSSNVV